MKFGNEIPVELHHNRSMQSKLWSLTLAFFVWALAIGSAVAWGLQSSGRFFGGFGANTPRAASVMPDNEGVLVDPSSVSRLFGAVETPTEAIVPPTMASRLVLLGVASGSNSAALISVDGKPAKPFVVGGQVAEGLVLHSVSPRRAMLATAVGTTPSLTLEMPKLTEAARGKPAG